MATTLLSLVNSTLRRARIINSTTEVLTSLTVSRIQIDIDMAVDAINDSIRELYSYCNLSPHETKAGTLTLVTDQREYALPSNFVTIAADRMVSSDAGYFMTPYPGGYEAMFSQQIHPDDYDGQPTHWVVNPVTDAFRLDTAPAVEQNDDVYNYLYTSDLSLTILTDTTPFNDSVTRALVPSIVERFRRYSNGDDQYDPAVMIQSMGQAVQALKHNKTQKHYG